MSQTKDQQTDVPRPAVQPLWKEIYKKPWTDRDRALLVAGIRAWDRGETVPPPNKQDIPH